MSSLEGRTVAIAGAGGGLGPDVARRLADEGANLALTDIDVGRLEALANDLGLPSERIDFREVDLLDDDSARQWCDHLEQRFGGTDALVHLVGGWKGGDPIATTPLSDYEWLHDLLVHTVQHATRAFYDALAESAHGRFVLVSSAQAQNPDGTNASYAATKAAAETWTLALADQFRKDESAATSNVIVINAILTPKMRADDPDKPFKTFTSTEDIADAIAFTLSDGAAKMNGKRLALHPVKDFASDNHAGVHPDLLEAIATANVEHSGSYGADEWTQGAEAAFREHFGAEARVFPVFNGTGANVASMDALTAPYEAAICTDVAHMQVDECGAPERLAQTKLLLVEHTDGKLTASDISRWEPKRGDEHHVQPRVVSITQATELGTVYTLEETRAIADEAHRLGMHLHVDGARLSNAAAALGVSLRELTTDAGVDIVSFGATKNGALVGDAVVILNPELAHDFVFTRKQLGQLASKMRFISTQLTALLADGLWLRNAAHANEMAHSLAAAVSEVPTVEIVYPVEANAVFARLPRQAIDDLLESLEGEHPFYIWDEADNVVRWMCAWDTTAEDVERFAAAVAASARTTA